MGCDFWVAPNGSDTAAGSEAAPFATFQKAYDTLCPAPPNASGTVACQGTSPNWSICFKSGTYALNASLYIRSTRSGTQAKTLKVMAAPNATTRPILNFSTQPRLAAGDDPENTDRGIKVNADWTLVKGFEVTRANDNGIHIQGANNVVENCVVHDNDDTGIQIGVNTSAASGTSGINNTVRNCDSYRNYDAVNGGENADGFGMKEAVGAGNKFIGCRAWENADDGYDFFAWLSPVMLQDCWALRNAMNASTTGSNSDGNGFKLGGDDMGGNHMLVNCSAFNNKAHGYTNNSGASSTCTGCSSCSNGDSDQGVSGVSSGGCPTTTRGMAPRNMDGTISP
jgi:pectate disaccharide-lyase